MFFLFTLSFVWAQQGAPLKGKLTVSSKYNFEKPCSKEVATCPKEKVIWKGDRQRYVYEMKCTLVNKEKQVKRLAYLKKRTYDGAMIVGENLDSCVTGGIAAVKKKYERAFSAYYKPRQSKGEKKPRFRFASYDGKSYSLDEQTYRGPSLPMPLCMPEVTTEEGNITEPRTHLFHLHCGRPSTLKNNCDDKRKYSKIKMKSSYSKKLDLDLEEFHSPKNAIADMNEALSKGCSYVNKPIPKDNYVVSWKLGLSETKKLLQKHITKNGFSLPLEPRIWSLIGTTQKEAQKVFTRQDVSALNRKLKSVKGGKQTELLISDLKKQFDRAKRRKPTMVECEPYLAPVYSEINDLKEKNENIYKALKNKQKSINPVLQRKKSQLNKKIAKDLTKLNKARGNSTNDLDTKIKKLEKYIDVVHAYPKTKIRFWEAEFWQSADDFKNQQEHAKNRAMDEQEKIKKLKKSAQQNISNNIAKLRTLKEGLNNKFDGIEDLFSGPVDPVPKPPIEEPQAHSLSAKKVEECIPQQYKNARKVHQDWNDKHKPMQQEFEQHSVETIREKAKLAEKSIAESGEVKIYASRDIWAFLKKEPSAFRKAFLNPKK